MEGETKRDWMMRRLRKELIVRINDGMDMIQRTHTSELKALIEFDMYLSTQPTAFCEILPGFKIYKYRVATSETGRGDFEGGRKTPKPDLCMDEKTVG